ncbi:sugar MFS transporter [Sphingomonas lacunae]|uniref:Sugar MFS transporter n=1 Tax=Sphingomonas lacunae TaxID=2698828 RepID=A0A6M4AWB8_9SPHN|nr:sugar MFS transporter [Sphingomonas lacunae]QJQ32602.1 sugar MFS transporter [Sphingomonas lacunae]
MAITPISTQEPISTRTADRTLFLLSLGLFFIWGFATVLIDILIPKLRGLFELSFAEAMLTQFAFFLGYFIFSLPAGWAVAKLGYIRGIILGLAVMTAGCLLFVPAARIGVYPGFLAALFIMAAGITVLQVSANAVISISGDPAKASARLTLAQAFNSFGTFIGPMVGAALILDDGIVPEQGVDTLTPEALAAVRSAEAAAVLPPYLGIAAILLVLMAVFWAKRDMLPRSAPEAAGGGLGLDLLANRRVAFGVMAIFAYVGAEVSIGSLLVNYLAQPSVLSASEASAGKLISLYWGGAMIGRFAGSWILARLSPGRVLAGAATIAIALSAVSAVSAGMVAAATVLAIGLANSIMFPTIFSQAVIGLNERETPRAAALLCMGIVGGALLPLAAGAVADSAGLSWSLIVPALGYAWVAIFGLYVARETRGETR